MVAAIGAVAGVAGAAISANSASNAADAQSAASGQATQAQMMAQAQVRQDLSPWVSSGGAAQNRLNQYLGIGGAGTGAVTSMGLGTGLTPDQVRQQLMSRFTSTSAPTTGNTGQMLSNGIAAPSADQIAQMPPALQEQWRLALQNNEAPLGSPESLPNFQAPTYAGASTVDETGLNAAIQQYYAEQNALNAQAQSDPTYGSLLTPFHNGAEFDPGPAFSFTGQNLASDPGYQFGLNQGLQGIDRAQASRGNFLSGAAVKEATRYNEDYAGTKFNDAFNRNLTSYNTNLGARQNAWNTNLSAYNDNRNRIYNFLSGVSGLGQNAAAQVGNNTQQVANNVSNNMLASGNAQAAGMVGTGNALTSGINQAANAYNSTNNLNSAGGWNNLLSQQGGGYSGYTGYVGNQDPIANLNNSRGWTG